MVLPILAVRALWVRTSRSLVLWRPLWDCFRGTRWWSLCVGSLATFDTYLMHCWCSTSFTRRMLLTWSLSVYDGIVGTKCCSIISCLDRQWKLRHFFNGDMPSNNITQNQPKNSCKPADFGQNFAVSPQFPCVQDVGFWLGLGRIKLSTHTQREDKF